jgi:hypothetical protein
MRVELLLRNDNSLDGKCLRVTIFLYACHSGSWMEGFTGKRVVSVVAA